MQALRAPLLALSLGALSSPSAAAPPRAGAAAPLPSPRITLEITPGEADAPWSLRVKNEGEVPLRLVADPRLLRLTITPPKTELSPRKKPEKPFVCALPEDARPTNDIVGARVLGPGKSFSQRFDVRFFCFGAAAEAALARGGQVVATYGFVSNARKITGPYAVGPIDGLEPALASMKAIEARPLTLPPHAAGAPVPAPAPSSTPPTASPAPSSATSPTPTSVTSPAPPSTATPPPATSPAPSSEAAQEGALPPPQLVLTSTPTVDVAEASGAMVPVSLRNASSRPVTLFFRPSTLGFDATSPSGGQARCSLAIAPPAIRELFSTVPPRGAIGDALALDQLCPGGFFAERGIYTLRAHLDTRRVPADPRLGAFQGDVLAGAPTLVRVRTGRAPSLEALKPSFD